MSRCILHLGRPREDMNHHYCERITKCVKLTNIFIFALEIQNESIGKTVMWIGKMVKTFSA